MNQEKWLTKEMVLANRAKQKRRQNFIYSLLYLASFAAVAVLFLIIGYIFVNGLKEISWEFLTGPVKDAGREGGIFPVIINTLYFVGLGLLFAAPLSILAALYMTEYSRQGPLIKVIRFFTTNLAGIPSIIFGLFGFMVFNKFFGWGYSLLSGAATVAVVILPTLIRTSEEAIMTVPAGYKEGSLALGATKWQTMRKVVIPAASPGIINGIILGMGRIFGETAALMYTLGMGTELVKNLFGSGRSLALHLYAMIKEVSAAKGYGTAVLLVMIVLILNLIAGIFDRRINRYKENL